MGDFAKEFEESEDIRVTADQIVDKTIKDVVPQ